MESMEIDSEKIHERKQSDYNHLVRSSLSCIYFLSEITLESNHVWSTLSPFRVRVRVCNFDPEFFWVSIETG